MTDSELQELSAEDAKLVTLARGARGRIAAAEGAAVRDETGRTYAAASVTLATMSLTAIELAVASAMSAGARSLECVVVVRDAVDLTTAESTLIEDLGGALVLVCAPDGSVRHRHDC